uniref:Uncharacterized protein n=1 Tax=Plectus sambesii TaxID=2011161 RepID=A0A914V031_9BILA
MGGRRAKRAPGRSVNKQKREWRSYAQKRTIRLPNGIMHATGGRGRGRNADKKRRELDAQRSQAKARCKKWAPTRDARRGCDPDRPATALLAPLTHKAIGEKREKERKKRRAQCG